MEISLGQINTVVLDMVSRSRIGIIHTQLLHRNQISENSKYKILLLENKFGINFKVKKLYYI